MSQRATGLAQSFCRTHHGAAIEADEALETALHGFWERGSAAWPDVRQDPVSLAAYLGERAPEDTAPAAWLAERDAGDLFIACACAEGVPRAVRAFDAAFVSKLGAYLRNLSPTPELVAETKQVLLEKLFVGSPGKLPRITQYRGQGALEGWVRVAAVRTALNLLAAERAAHPPPDEAEEIARAIVPARDPELELLRATYQDDFRAAFRASIAGLSRRDRALLRFTFIEHLTPAHIGAIYGCHRTTAMRWIDAARDEILARTRDRLMERLHVSPSELDRIFVLVRSRIDITINALLATAS
jgi:RNA polymerase sigma-70 factor (ECF subfamily)